MSNKKPGKPIHKNFHCIATAVLLLISFSGWGNNAFAQNNEGIGVIANHDKISMYENHTWITNVLNNDYGINEGISQLTIATPPKHGKAEVLQDYTIKYTPNLLFIGFDEFEYQLCNIHGNCDVATVFVEVMEFDFQPIAVNDTAKIFEDSFSSIDVLANDLNLYDLPISLTIVKNFTHNLATVVDNKIQLNINRYFMQMDTLIYEVCDKDGDCDRATLFVSLVEEEDDSYFIPQGFSPDGDGINDTFWVPEFEHFADISITIYNRNGIMVFNDTAYNNNWDGTANTGIYNGKNLPSGVYYYILKIGGDLEREFKGSVYLSR